LRDDFITAPVDTPRFGGSHLSLDRHQAAAKNLNDTLLGDRSAVE
jgi:hypothetical protein